MRALSPFASPRPAFFADSYSFVAADVESNAEGIVEVPVDDDVTEKNVAAYLRLAELQTRKSLAQHPSD